MNCPSIFRQDMSLSRPGAILNEACDVRVFCPPVPWARRQDMSPRAEIFKSEISLRSGEAQATSNCQIGTDWCCPRGWWGGNAAWRRHTGSPASGCGPPAHSGRHTSVFRVSVTGRPTIKLELSFK